MNFETAIERVLSHEGGYVNSAEDPGGETQWGISKRSYPAVNIRSLTRDQAKRIYFEDFWTPVLAHTGVTGAICYQLLDSAVNHGMGTTVRLFQRALNVADDGHFGAVSMKAASTMSGNDQLMRFLAERLSFMAKLKTFPHFGAGWSQRIAANLRYAATDNTD